MSLFFVRRSKPIYIEQLLDFHFSVLHIITLNDFSTLVSNFNDGEWEKCEFKYIQNGQFCTREEFAVCAWLLRCPAFIRATWCARFNIWKRTHDRYFSLERQRWWASKGYSRDETGMSIFRVFSGKYFICNNIPPIGYCLASIAFVIIYFYLVGQTALLLILVLTRDKWRYYRVFFGSLNIYR